MRTIFVEILQNVFIENVESHANKTSNGGNEEYPGQHQTLSSFYISFLYFYRRLNVSTSHRTL